MKQYYWCIFSYLFMSVNPTFGSPTWQPLFDVSPGIPMTWTPALDTTQPKTTTWAPVISVGLPSCAGLLPVDCKRLHIKYYIGLILAKQEKKIPLIDRILG